MSGWIMVGLIAGSTVTDALVADIVEGRGELPPLAAVQRWTIEAMAVPDDDDARGWPGRARRRGLLPELRLGFGSDADVDIRDSLAADFSRTTTDRRGLGFDVGARWLLGDLVFSDSELRASREALARSAAIRIVADEATRLYFERVELLLLEGSLDPLVASIRAASVEGALDVITGGQFSRWKGDNSFVHDRPK